MNVTQLYTESLSQASYLVADERARQAIVVDPLRDIQQYLDLAHAMDVTIVGTVLTHFHADFLAGHLELAEATGAWIGLGARAHAEFDARLLADGERIALGETVIEIMSTPGHTPESISILVFEHEDDPAPHSVLTGDSLFVGDVGRVDLQASFGADPLDLAHEQYETIQHRLMRLPDPVRVMPAHGAGSACGKNLSPDRESTIGRERSTNPNCRPMPIEDFVAELTSGQMPAPAYFVEDARLNRSRHPLFDSARSVPLLSAEGAIALMETGAAILDTRDAESFAAGRIAGSLGVPLRGRFAETAGMFLDYAAAPAVIVAEPGTEHEVVVELARIGFDSVAGVLPSPSLVGELLIERMVTGQRVDVPVYESLRSGIRDRFVLDVRGPGEFEDGSIPGAVNIPLPQLARRAGELPRKGRILVNCASGWRSSVAAGYLEAAGFDAVDLRGGYEAWRRASDEPLLPVVGGDLEVPLAGGGSRRAVNLDYGASSPSLVRVAERVAEFLPYSAGVHRGAGYASMVATAAYEDARATVHGYVGAGAGDEVIFTRNTTDSLNLLASAVAGRGPGAARVVVLDIEHHADLLPWTARGAQVVAAASTIEETLDRLERALAAERTALLAITGAGNVTGETLPLARLAELAHGYGARISVDAAQLIPHRRVDMTATGIDYLSFSGHKVYAPFGAGALVGRQDWLDRAEPYLRGGGAVLEATTEEVCWRTGPDRNEAGSPNVVGAVALAESLLALSEVEPGRWAAHEQRIRRALTDGLGAIPGVRLLRMFSDSADSVGVVAFEVEGMDAGLIAAALAAEWGIGVRDGRFCAHPLMERLLDGRSAIRASFGVGSRVSDARLLVEAIDAIVRDGPSREYRLLDEGWALAEDERPLPGWLPETASLVARHGCLPG